jgi:hypothetical protein
LAWWFFFPEIKLLFLYLFSILLVLALFHSLVLICSFSSCFRSLGHWHFACPSLFSSK